MKMIKIFLFMFFSLNMFLFISSCVPRRPYGVWKSEYPNIIFFMDQAYEPPRDIRVANSIRYVGLYSTDYETIKLFMMPSASPHFTFYPIHFHNAGSAYRGKWLSWGSWRVIRGKLHYTLIEAPAFGLEIGDTIIFRRITDYEPPNFDEWFPPVE